LELHIPCMTLQTDVTFGQARVVCRDRVGRDHFTVDPAAPFGGVKASGLGRELEPEGLSAYLRIRSIYKQAPAAQR
jgi:aldehyde dehydrogenase (NAD+)